MEIRIDGHPIEAAPGESLLSLVRKLGLDTGELSTRPLAARLAGETYTLNYIPVRSLGDPAVPTARRPVRRARGEVSLVRYGSDRGKRLYERSLLFVFLLAVRTLFPQARVRIDYAVGAAICARVEKTPAITRNEVEALRAECRRIVEADHPLVRQRMDIDDAIDFFADDGQIDKVNLLEWRRFTYFDVYGVGDFKDYLYGEMVPSTAFVSVFDLMLAPDGCVLVLRPSEADPCVPAVYTPLPKLSATFRESAERERLLQCDSVADLNDSVRSGSIRRLIRVNEALHEKRYAQIADEIIARGARAVLIAGPSSSGKTTSANRLCTQLQVHGKSPVLLSLDDYYIDRDKVVPDENGQIDLEHINTIDTDLFREHLYRLLRGETVSLPRFDFKSQRRIPDCHTLRIDADTPLVIEGLHGLNPMLLPDAFDKNLIYRLYVTALTTLNLDDHNRISTAEVRLLRRMVRDYETRGSTVEHTLSMWASVRRGEERWIFPYQEQADAMFNSALVYEPAVLKKHIFPLLQAVRPDSPYFDEVNSIVKFLNYIVEANVDDEIPPTSVLREFIGGNAFYR